MKDFSLDDYFGVETFMKGVELYEKLNTEIFTLKDTGLTYKIINDWDNAGLLNLKRGKAAGWRKFSFLDYLWIKVINEFRSIGTPIPLIRNLRDGVNEQISFKWLIEILEYNLEKIEKTNKESYDSVKEFIHSKKSYEINEEDGLSIFLLLVIETITKKAPVSLILFPSAEWMIWNEDKKSYSIEDVEKVTFKTHTTVSISEIIKSFLYSDKSIYVLPKLNILKENELRLLQIINSGEYESVTINFRNKKMKSLEMVKEQDVKRKVIDIISENKYQDIVIKSHKGIVTKIQNTIKVLLD
jgi:DNA-binding transcriptional MerR regulator